MVEYLNKIAQQLEYGFQTESNKIRYFRSSVIAKSYATTPLKNISTGQFNFDYQVMALNGSLQLECEMKKGNSSSTIFYSQFMSHPKYVRKNGSSHSMESRNHGDN